MVNPAFDLSGHVEADFSVISAVVDPGHPVGIAERQSHASEIDTSLCECLLTLELMPSEFHRVSGKIMEI